MTSASPIVVVGIDFSENSQSALRYAAEHAERHGGSVVAVHAWSYPWWMATPIGAMRSPGSVTPEVRSHAERRLLELASEVATDVEVQPRVVEGSTVEVLADIGGAADVVVLGAHAGKLTSSTAHRLVGEIDRPVMVVPEKFRRRDRRPILVGMDGSEDSSDALRWAIEHASGRDIVALRVWQVTATGAVAPVNFDRALWRTSARKALEHNVSQALASVESPPRIKRIVDTGDPRTVLRRHAAEASMLVIGARGHGAVSHFLLGSAAASMAAHPPCPTTLVPTPATAT